MVYSKYVFEVSQGYLTYYTDIPFDVGDVACLSTKYGTIPGICASLLTVCRSDPFKDGTAKALVLENCTKQIHHKGVNYPMKTVTIKHLNSNRHLVSKCNCPLAIDDLVVYETKSGSMHIGTVIELNPAQKTAESDVVMTISLDAYKNRKETEKRAKNLYLQLMNKKKHFHELELFALMSANDPEAQQLFDEYKTLLKELGSI